MLVSLVCLPLTIPNSRDLFAYTPLISCTQINKHKRHLDKGALLEFWRVLDEFMLLKKAEMM